MMQKINVLGGKVNLNGDVIPAENAIKADNPELDAVVKVQEVIFDKMIANCGVNGTNAEFAIWNELGIQLLYIRDRIKGENAQSL